MHMPFKFIIGLCRLTWISRAVTCTDWPGYPVQSHTETDLGIQGSHMHRLTWISRAVTHRDWPGYPGQSHAQTDLDIQGSHTHTHTHTDWPGYPGQSHAQTDLDIQGSHLHHAHTQSLQVKKFMKIFLVMWNDGWHNLILISIPFCTVFEQWPPCAVCNLGLLYCISVCSALLTHWIDKW